MRSAFIAAISLVFLSCSVVAKEVIYVTQEAGNDANVGSVSKPLRTITRAINLAQPGDTILVDDGDYRGEDTGWGAGVIPISKSGKPDKWITIQSRGEAKSVVSSFLLNECSYIRVKGIHFKGFDFGKVKNWKDMPTIVRDKYSEKRPDFTLEYPTRAKQIEAEFATYLGLIKQLEYTNAIELRQVSNVELRENRIEGYWAGIQCKGSKDVRIEKNEIRHTVNGIFSWKPSPALQNSFIRENVIEQSLDIGISVQEGSNGVAIRDNTVRHSGTSHISLHNGVRKSTIAGNDVSYGGYYAETMKYPGCSGISVHSSLDGNSIVENKVSYQLDHTNIDGNGIILDLMKDGSSVLIRGNLSKRNMGAGINLTKSPNCQILDNTLAQNGYRSSGYRVGAGIKLARDQDVNNQILNNVFITNREAGILGYRTIKAQKKINGNRYTTDREPLIWDGYEVNEADYRTLSAVRAETGFEATGRWNEGKDVASLSDDESVRKPVPKPKLPK